MRRQSLRADARASLRAWILAVRSMRSKSVAAALETPPRSQASPPYGGGEVGLLRIGGRFPGSVGIDGKFIRVWGVGAAPDPAPWRLWITRSIVLDEGAPGKISAARPPLRDRAAFPRTHPPFAETVICAGRHPQVLS